MLALAPAPLAASLTWTSDDPALGSAGLDGSLQARVPLGALAGSPEFAFPVQLVHRFDHAVESRRLTVGPMEHRFRWQEDAGALGIDYRGHGGRLLRWQAADGRSLDVRWQEVAAGHHVVGGLRSGGQERWSDFKWALHHGFDPADDREQVSQPVALVADDRARYQVGRDNKGYRLARTDALGQDGWPARATRPASNGAGTTTQWAA